MIGAKVSLKSILWHCWNVVVMGLAFFFASALSMPSLPICPFAKYSLVRRCHSSRILVSFFPNRLDFVFHWMLPTRIFACLNKGHGVILEMFACTHTCIYIIIYIYMCVCVLYMWVSIVMEFSHILRVDFLLLPLLPF